MVAFEVTLDTTPPVLSIGPVAAIVRGAMAAIPFALDEPRVVGAWLDGRPLQVDVDRLRGPAPRVGDAATLEVLVRDEVDNEDRVTVGVPLLRSGMRVEGSSPSRLERSRSGTVERGRSGKPEAGS